MANMGFPKDGEPNQGWKLYLTSLIMVLCAGLIVIARIATRLRVSRLMVDDYTIIASLVFSIFLSVTIQLAVVHGYGQHKLDLSTKELRTCLKYFWIAQTPYKIVVCLNKTSVVLLYMRIFISKNFRWVCYVALAIIIGSGVATVFATIFQCVPLQRSWNKTVDGTCIDSSMFWIANAVLNIATDVIVLALPVREVWKLQLRLQEKIMLYAVFLLGGFVTITSILRVTAVANSVRNQQDQTWNFITRGVWTLIEANLGIICACLIVLKQAVKRCFSFVFSTTNATKPYGPRSGYGGSGAIGSAKRSASVHAPRKHYKLDETFDEEDLPEQTRGETHAGGIVWSDKEAFHMTTLARRDTSEDGRSSDERYLKSNDTHFDFYQSSVDSAKDFSASSSGRKSGITKRVDVDINSRPATPIAVHR